MLYIFPAFKLIAGCGVNKSMNSHADLNDLALKNVLALADVENPDLGVSNNADPETKYKELPQRIWNEALHCAGGGATVIKCTVEGELEIGGS